MILGKMFEGEGDNKKSKEKRLFCCCNQNNYVFLQKQKTRGHHQHRIIWERALPGLRCKDNKKMEYTKDFFEKEPTWLSQFDRFDAVCQEIRKMMVWD